MARIRSIKPEFPQSEDIGKLSRDARLLFIQLWTIADDFGKARAASRMLASLLFPYDDDAPSLIDGWLSELERGEHIRRYNVDGSQYLEIANWLKHQKIDHPTPSRLPDFREILASPRETFASDLGPRIKDKDLGSRKNARARVRAEDALLSDDWPTDYETRFWNFWPNKVGKAPARKALAAARKRRCSFVKIMTGIADYIRDKPPDRPWLNPTTFLNQNRWEDQPATVSAGNGKARTGSGSLVGAIDRKLAEIEAEEHADLALPEGTVLRISTGSVR